MAEYIERTEELVLAVNAGARAIANTKRYHGTIYVKDVFSDHPMEMPYLKAAEILWGVEDIPAADVAPVVHGRWVWNEESECWVCSNCELSALNNYRGNSTDSNYCPNCGARMDGERYAAD